MNNNSRSVVKNAVTHSADHHTDHHSDHHLDHRVSSPHTHPQQSSSPAKLYPEESGFTPRQRVAVGAVILRPDKLEYNTSRRRATIKVRNTGDRPIQVGSHFHFFEVNRYLEFDRDAAFGMHLDIPATTAIRFEPGDEKQVELVSFGGKCRIIGFNNLTMGYAGLEEKPSYYPAHTNALKAMRRAGFKTTSAQTSSEQTITKHPHNDKK